MPPRRRVFSARDGLRLSALEWEGPAQGHGGATPLLCLSGVSRSSLDFEEIAARYRSTRRVVALDYAGHGESARAADPSRYAPPVLLQDVADAIAALGLHRVALLGTSLGGLIGMGLGTVRPGLLAGLAMNDTGPALEPGGLGMVRDFIGRDPAFGGLEEAIAFLKQKLPPLGITEQGWPRVAERTYRRGEDGRLHPRWDIRVVDALPAEGSGPDGLWPLFQAIPPVPLMLVWGQESRVLSASTVRRMRQLRPEMTLATLPGIGHAPTLSEPASLEALDRWLAAVR